MAKEKGYEFYTDDPQKLYPNELPRFIKEMEELGWDRGQDDEELFEFAMHEKQYREFKSGLAKEQFLKDLEQRRAKAGVAQTIPSAPSIPSNQNNQKADDDLAAVAYALYLAGKKQKEGTIALPHIKPTAWNHKFYTLK